MVFTGTIYAILDNEYFYIGSTTQVLETRISQHMADSKRDKFKNNKFYTIIVLNTYPYNKDGNILNYFSFVDQLFILFDKEKTTKEKDSPINKWSTEKSQINYNTPVDTISRYGVGSYGDGDPFIKKDILAVFFFLPDDYVFSFRSFFFNRGTLGVADEYMWK